MGQCVYFDLGGTEVRNRLTRYIAQKKLKPLLVYFALTLGLVNL